MSENKFNFSHFQVNNDLFSRTSSEPVRDHSDETKVIVQGEIDPRRAQLIEAASKGELKAKLAAVLDRGVVQDRLQVDLPSDLYGEWVRNDPLEIRRMETLGFKIDDTYAPKRAIHSDGTSGGIVGDVIFMICPRQVHEVIEEVKRDKIIEQHQKKRFKSGDINKEEKDYMRAAGELAHIESSERSADYDHIKSTLEAINNQTQPT